MWRKFVLSQDGTVWMLLVALMVLVVWNTAVTMYQFPGATISETLLYVAQKWPVIPLMVGCLIGHVFWPQYRAPLAPLPAPQTNKLQAAPELQAHPAAPLDGSRPGG